MKEVRPGDQQHPTVNQNPYIQELVLEDLKERMAEGVSRYGTLLQGHNDRDMLQDAYDEAMDLCIYLRGAIWERDNPVRIIPEGWKFPLASDGCCGDEGTIECCQCD